MKALVVLLPLLAMGCVSLDTLKPCANIQTDETTWTIGVAAGRDDHSCNDGIDNDLLRPDLYTNIRT